MILLFFFSGDIPAATAEDVEVAVEAARRALSRNEGKDWALASAAVRAKYLRAIASKVILQIQPSFWFLVATTICFCQSHLSKKWISILEPYFCYLFEKPMLQKL